MVHFLSLVGVPPFKTKILTFPTLNKRGPLRMGLHEIEIPGILDHKAKPDDDYDGKWER